MVAAYPVNDYLRQAYIGDELLNMGDIFNDPKGIVHVHGFLEQERYDWIVNELEKGQTEGKLMIIAAHVPIPLIGLYSTSPASISSAKLVAKLHTYPNLIMWASGHRHRNVITPMKSPDADHPELGFWEIETASLKDFPQQFRMFDIVRNSDKTVSI